jgi:hypothetical protein
MVEHSMNDEPETKVGLWKVVLSVIAAMFGVRGSKAHERDFTKGRPAAYIIVGLILTVVFILTIAGVVTLVMKLAGG